MDMDVALIILKIAQKKCGSCSIWGIRLGSPVLQITLQIIRMWELWIRVGYGSIRTCAHSLDNHDHQLYYNSDGCIRHSRMST